MRKVFTNPDRQEQLMRNGYVPVPLLSAEEVRSLVAEFDKLRPDDGFRRQLTRNGAPTLMYHCTFLDRNVAYKRRVAELIHEVFDAHVRSVLDGYEIINANFYVKPPRAGEFTIHQNWPLLRDVNDTTLTMWCPLHDTDERNGTIEVVPGSHKIVPDIAGVNVKPFFAGFQQALIDKYLQPVPRRAGEALFFDDSLLHWSSRNDSDTPRIAVQVLLIPIGAQPVYFHYDPAHPERFELFELDAEYYVTHSAEDLPNIPRERRSLGFITNPNRMLTEEEFVERMAAGDETRRKAYAD